MPAKRKPRDEMEPKSQPSKKTRITMKTLKQVKKLADSVDKAEGAGQKLLLPLQSADEERAGVGVT